MIVLKFVLSWGVVSLVGCQEIGLIPSERELGEMSPAGSFTRASRTFQGIVKLQREFAEAAIRTVEPYLPATSLGHQSGNGGVEDIEYLDTLLPEDLSTLRRELPPPSLTRSGRGVEVTLEEGWMP